MAAIQSPLFFTLPSEIQSQIFDFALEQSESLGNRRICRQLLRVVDSVIKKKWEDLQKNPPLGPFGLQHACIRITKKYSVNGTYTENFNYLDLFRALHHEWKFIGMNIYSHQLNVATSFQTELQTHLYHQLNDRSLMQMWSRILPKTYQFAWPVSTAASIRECFSYPHIQTVLSSIDKMNFSDLEIRLIPIEISYFGGMTELKLCCNNIDYLPDFIGNLKNLRVLNLEDNDMQELPRDFPKWTHLKEVNLKDNPLNSHGLWQVAEWKKNVAALHSEVPMELESD